MKTSFITTLTVLIMLGVLTPVQAQRLGNSSLDFYEQGMGALQQEIERLQATPTEKTPLWIDPQVPVLPVLNRGGTTDYPRTFA